MSSISSPLLPAGPIPAPTALSLGQPGHVANWQLLSPASVFKGGRKGGREAGAAELSLTRGIREATFPLHHKA